MKFEPTYKASKDLKTYTYGPFFVLMLKNDISLEWMIRIRMGEDHKRQEVRGAYAFRATDKNVKEKIEKLIYEKNHEIIKLIFEG